MKYLLLLITGVMMYWDVYCLNGRPPNYSQDQMPITSFSCRDKILGGYYADPETHCQMFHVCVKVPGLGVQDYKFLCPNDTSFDQENQICDDWYNIDCEAATLFYSDNFDLYRIGSESGREAIRNAPRLPSNNVNNAVSDVDDDSYLQRSDRGESVGSDLLRGSHSSNFYSNKYRGREEEDLKEELNKKKKAGANKNQVRKLLTGKRPVTPSPQVAYQDNSQTVAQPSPQPRLNPGARGRTSASNFQRAQPSVATEAPQRQTEVYNNQRPNFNNNNNYNNNNYNNNFNNNNQRNFYTPTTPKAETVATQRNDYFKNNFYNPVTQPTARPNFYNGPQNNYNTPSTFAPTNTQVTTASNRFTQIYQTTRTYPTYSNPSSTETPITYISVAPTVVPADRVNHYETQKLYKLNTAAFQQASNQDQYDDSKDDEFLKTAHSQNLGASNFNHVQNSFKHWNATLNANYNFQPAATTLKPNPAYQQNYSPTTSRPSSHFFQTQNTNNQQNTVYTPSSTLKPYEAPKNNFFTPTTTVKPAAQFSYTTPSTTLRPYSPVQQSTYFAPSTTQRPNQQTQNNYYTPSAAQRTTQPQSFPAANNVQNNFYSTATPAPQNNYQQRNFYQQTPSANTYQQQNNFRSQTPTVKSYQEPAKAQNTPVQQKPRSRGSTLYSHTTDATENPRPFTVPTPASKHPETKDKDQYDYAYYDDGTQGSEYDVDTVDFARTKSKVRS